MSLLTNLKLNYITNQLKQVENTTANADVLNAVIKFINDNIGEFQPTIDITKLNAFVSKYLIDNSDKFKGQPGPPVSQSDVVSALTAHLNSTTNITFINASFTVIKQILNNLTCGNTILQYYNIQNQDDEYDITTHNIQAKIVNLTGSLSIGNNLLNFYPSNNTSNNDLKTNVAQIDKITCKELHAKVGSVSDGTEKITFYDNVSFSNGFTTSSITTNDLVVSNINNGNKGITFNDTIQMNKKLTLTDLTSTNFNSTNGTIPNLTSTNLTSTNGTITNLTTGNLSNSGNGISCNDKLTIGNTIISKNSSGSGNTDLQTKNLIVSNISNNGNALNINDSINTLTCKTINGVSQDWDPNLIDFSRPLQKVGTIFNHDIKFIQPIRTNNINPLSSTISIGSLATHSTQVIGNFSIANKFDNATPCIFDTDLTITGRLNCGSVTSRTLYNVNTKEDSYVNNLSNDFAWINQIHILGAYSAVVLPSIFNAGQFGTPIVPYGSYVGFIRNRISDGLGVLSSKMTIYHPNCFDGNQTYEDISAGQIAIYMVIGKGYAKMFS